MATKQRLRVTWVLDHAMIGCPPLDLQVQVNTRDLTHSIHNLATDGFRFSIHVLLQIGPVAVAVLVKIDHEIERLLEPRVDETDLRRLMRGLEFAVQVLVVVILPDILFIPPEIETGDEHELPPV